MSRTLEESSNTSRSIKVSLCLLFTALVNNCITSTNSIFIHQRSGETGHSLKDYDMIFISG